MSVAILSSHVGLGTFIPAMITYSDLKALGIETQIYILESFYTEEKKRQFEITKTVFRQNTRAAQLASSMPISRIRCISADALQSLFYSWKKNQVKEIICFSGLWFEIMEMLKREIGNVFISFVQMDAVRATYWKGLHSPTFDHVFHVFDNETQLLNFYFDVKCFTAKPLALRSKNLVLHGGGWGLGDYLSQVSELPETIGKKVVIPELQLVPERHPSIEFFVNILKEGASWPRLVHANDLNSKDEDSRDLKYHNILDLINDSYGVITKPGGMSIMDSLIAETPLIYLDPVGLNETGNGTFVEKTKIGLHYRSWKKMNFDFDVLSQLNQEIKQLKKRFVDFTTLYLNLKKN